jgi:hypothetical protein
LIKTSKDMASQVNDSWEELRLNHMHLENPSGYTEWGYTAWESPILSESIVKETQKTEVVEEKSLPVKETEKTGASCVCQ